MRVVVSGSSGLIGSALVPALADRGHQVVRLVRGEPAAPDEFAWDPQRGRIDRAALEGTDVVVNLSGAGTGDHRWTTAYKATIRDSRVNSTLTLARTAAQVGIPRLVCASAMGYYGDTGCRPVDESAPPGTLFASTIVRDWEAAADPARDAGVSVAHARSALVVSRRGGAWGRMIPLFKLGLGGRLGDGSQCWSVISLRDEVRALIHLVEGDLEGPVNASAPHTPTNAQITREMGQALHRPSVMRVPRIALRIGLGELSSEVLTSTHVIPRRLLDDGFDFRDPTFADALHWALHEEA